MINWKRLWQISEEPNVENRFLLFILILLAVVSSPLILTFNLVIIVFFKLNFWLGVYNKLRVFILNNF